MIMLTKEQLADLLRESFKIGVCLGVSTHKSWIDSEPFHNARERAIQPLVHRYSGAQYRERPNHSVHRGRESLPCHCWAESDHPIGKEVSGACECADAKRLAWMIEKAQTGSIGFGDFVLYPGDALDDVRAVIDSAMDTSPKDVGGHDDHGREVKGE